MPAVPGLKVGANDHSPLFGVSYQDIAAVVSTLTSAKVQPTEANLWLHETVVEALMVDRAVLPVRFGTVLANEAAVQAVLTAHHADFVANLKRVRGRVELGLRVLWEIEEQGSGGAGEQGGTPAPSHLRREGSGRSYLLARLAEERQVWARRRRAEALAAEIHAPLARLAAEDTRQVLITPRLLLTAAYLVDRDQVATFRQEVEALSAAYPALRFLCTGPWPPYSFVTAGGPETTTDSQWLMAVDCYQLERSKDASS
ncbi:MAG: GvpL/GvpF family gas vesicle protein [Chloroflexi bacterium]|nr:GvpL/GvpF family gas vesicle protein [Chloroflexota bacterium]